jgi:type VI secretion system secreted protein Hcp
MAKTLFFLEIDGVKGDCQDHQHKGHFDVHNWHVGATHPANVNMGGGGHTGKTAFSDLSFTTHLCNGCTDMFKFCANGKTIPKATLKCYREAGDSRIKYLEVKMENVMVSGYNTSTHGDNPTADYSLNFAKLTLAFTSQSKSGGAGATVTHYWDINNNSGG